MNRLIFAPSASRGTSIGMAIVCTGIALIALAELGRGQTALAAETTTKSIVTNGNMEEGDRAPVDWKQGAAVPGVRYTWDRGTGRVSKASLRLHKTVRRYFPVAQWYQVLPEPGGASELRVSAWVKAEKASKAVVTVLFAGQNGKQSHKWVAYIGAENANDPPVSHDWKEYSGVAEIPPGTKQIGIALQIYGPGKLWFDDVQAEFVSGEAPKSGAAPRKAEPPADVADVPSQDLTIGGKPNMRYFLIGPRKDVAPPENGFKLLVVLPGGDGSADFNPFIRRIFKNALSAEYLVAQPVAFKWRPNQRITWPTRTSAVEGQQFATEDFVAAVVGDVKSRHKLDEGRVFTLSWSSGGPAAYAISLAEDTPITGSYVAMSVFQPNNLPPLANGKGHRYYIEHSPDDRVCPFRMAEQAERSLKENDAIVRFNTYEGGHGWRGDVYGRIRGGIQWLEGAVVE